MEEEWEKGGRVLVDRDLPWEQSRSEGVGREKLGHVEKSSCNDPTLGPADGSHVWLSSLNVYINFLHSLIFT